MLSIEEIKLLIEKLEKIKGHDFQKMIDDNLKILKTLAQTVDINNQDQINRLELRIDEADVSRKQMKEDHKIMKAKLDHMYDILLEYISKSK